MGGRGHKHTAEPSSISILHGNSVSEPPAYTRGTSALEHCSVLAYITLVYTNIAASVVVVSLRSCSSRCPRLHRCTEVLLSALVAKKVASKEDLKKAWKDEPKCE